MSYRQKKSSDICATTYQRYIPFGTWKLLHTYQSLNNLWMVVIKIYKNVLLFSNIVSKDILCGGGEQSEYWYVK